MLQGRVIRNRLRGVLHEACPARRQAAQQVAGVSSDDQRRVATPASALADGADVLVIGRAVTEARDPAEAADRIMAEAEAALGAT